MKGRIAGLLAGLAVLGAVMVPSASAATAQQRLRQLTAESYNVPITRVDLNVLNSYAFSGFYCKLNNTQHLFAGDYYGAFGQYGGEITWQEDSTIPCNHNADQEPFA